MTADPVEIPFDHLVRIEDHIVPYDDHDVTALEGYLRLGAEGGVTPSG